MVSDHDLGALRFTGEEELRRKLVCLLSTAGRPAGYLYPFGSRQRQRSTRATVVLCCSTVWPEDLVKLTQLTKITLKEAKSKIEKLTVAYKVCDAPGRGTRVTCVQIAGHCTESPVGSLTHTWRLRTDHSALHYTTPSYSQTHGVRDFP